MLKTKLSQEEGEVWSEPADIKIKLRKVKHEMNARVTIRRRRDMVRANQKKKLLN